MERSKNLNWLFNSGFKIVVQEPVPIKEKVKRTFWERVFSLSPFKALKEIQSFKDYLPDGEVMQVGDTIFVNQKTHKDMIKIMESNK